MGSLVTSSTTRAYEQFSVIKNQLNLVAHRLANISHLGPCMQSAREPGAGLFCRWQLFHYDFFCWGFVPSSARLAVNYRVNLKTVWYHCTLSCCGAEESAGRPGSAQLWQGHECFHSCGFLSKAGFFRKTTFLAGFCLVSSVILVLSAFVCHKTCSTNSKMDVEPRVEGTCLTLCYFTL